MTWCASLPQTEPARTRFLSSERGLAIGAEDCRFRGAVALDKAGRTARRASTRRGQSVLAQQLCRGARGLGEDRDEQIRPRDNEVP
jgi:hypothetical protein